MIHDRRALLSALPALALPATPRPTRPREAEEEISAPEDLMREHGVLNRILLIYEEGLRRLKGGQDVAPESFSRPATLVRRFVEEYHEKLEERFIFPRFERHATLASLAATLRDQHQAGRRLTEAILTSATALVKPEPRQTLIRSSESFIRMYRPHEAREDTVLFPALYKVAGVAAVKDLGERFEAEEHRLFGEQGFEKTVEEVAAIEKQLGIYELATFTPA
jgi:hemerythrin-like domain-containing protein